MATSAADWLTAIGTVGAVVVALGTPAVTWTIRRSRRPLLRIGMSEDEPNVRVVFDPAGHEPEHCWLRITVTNAGQTTAQHARAQIRRYWVREAHGEDAVRPWVECLIDPQPLEWVSRPSNVTATEREAVALPGGSSDLATFAYFTGATSQMVLVYLESTYVPPTPSTSEIVEFRFELTVNADNAEAATVHVWCDRTHTASKALLSAGMGRKPPSAAETRPYAPRLGNPGPTARDPEEISGSPSLQGNQDAN